MAAAAADKDLSHLNVKDERNYLGHEVGVGQRKFQVQRFSADGEKRVFLVSGGRVDPVELVGQGEQLELLQREVELPSVGHEVEQVRVRSNGPETKNSKTSIKNFSKGAHSTEVAFLLLNQQPWVQFPPFPKKCSQGFFDVAGIY